jgi:uncharacterized protein (TIGR02391 family)
MEKYTKLQTEEFKNKYYKQVKEKWDQTAASMAAHGLTHSSAHVDAFLNISFEYIDRLIDELFQAEKIILSKKSKRPESYFIALINEIINLVAYEYNIIRSKTRERFINIGDKVLDNMFFRIQEQEISTKESIIRQVELLKEELSSFVAPQGGHSIKEDLSVDYEVWDLENEFTSTIAACLWCGIDPCKESRDQNLKNKILKTEGLLEKAAEEGKIEPLFLFPEDRRSAQRTSIQNASKNNTELFDTLLLHPKITKVSKKLFADGHYAQAILEAFKAVNNAVKKKSGITNKDGQALMAIVFNEERPIIKLNSLKTQSYKDEQMGFKLLYMGAMTGIRNPKAHDHVTQIDPSRTLKYLAFASLLMEKIDEGTRCRRRTRSTGQSADT